MKRRRGEKTSGKFPPETGGCRGHFPLTEQFTISSLHKSKRKLIYPLAGTFHQIKVLLFFYLPRNQRGQAREAPVGNTCQPLCGRSVEVSWLDPFPPTVTRQAGCLSSIALLDGRSGYLLGTCVLMETPASRQQGGQCCPGRVGRPRPAVRGLFFRPGCCGPQRALVQPADKPGPESHRCGLSAVGPLDLTLFGPCISADIYYSMPENTGDSVQCLLLSCGQTWKLSLSLSLISLLSVFCSVAAQNWVMSVLAVYHMEEFVIVSDWLHLHWLLDQLHGEDVGHLTNIY